MPNDPVTREDEEMAYPLPEDPPQFGEDGLHFLNADARAAAPSAASNKKNKGTIDDALVEAASRGSDDDLAVKKTVGVAALDDYKQPSAAVPQMDPFHARMEREEAERAEWVWRRRHPSNPCMRVLQKIIPYGGIVSTAFNLASSTIGAGIISIPAGFQVSGIVMSVIYLVVVSSLTVYSFTLLTIVAQKTGYYHWERLARKLMGPGWDYLVVFVMWILCFGGDVSYTISLLNILAAFLDNSSHVSSYMQTTSGHRLITAMIWLGVVLPLCLPKEINTLRYFSAIAILLVTFFVICMVVHSGQSLHRRGLAPNIVYVQTGNAAVQGLSIYLFAFIAQVNYMHTLQEAYNPTLTRMFAAAVLGVGVCFVLYFCSGFFGYVDFGTQISDSVLPLYNPIKQPLFAVSYAGLALKVCVGFALHLIPCRDAVYYVLGTDVSKVPWWKNAIVSTIQASCAMIAGLFIPRITTVFGLLGGFCGGFIGFIFPAFFMMYAGNFSPRGVGWPHFLATYLLLIVGVIGVVFGTGAAIYGEVLAEQS